MSCQRRCGVGPKVAVLVVTMLMGLCSRGWAGQLTPYGGSPMVLPGTIQGANFDNGGEGVAYHDTTPGNAGGAYRATDVDLEAASGGGYDVGWVAAGEWLNYTVMAPVAGNYTAQLRVASPNGGGSLHIGFNGPSNVWKTVSAPVTGGWQNWTTVTVPVTLGAGVQQMTLLFDTSGFNLSSVTISAVSGGTGPSTPFSGTPLSISGVIPAANFDNGGEGVAYHDATSGNAGGAFRSTDVDLEPASAGGYDVGWVSAGEWLNYTVNVVTAGSYTITFRVAALGQGGTFHLAMNGTDVTGRLTVPNTGGWQSWQTVSATVSLAAGVQVARLVMDTNGVNAVGNFHSIEFASAGSTGSTTINLPAGGNLQAAIDSARPGDTIALAAGAVFAGSFVLPAKSGDGYVTIRSASPDGVLPADGVRVSPQYASRLAKVQGGFAGMPAFTTAPGAHHYRLQFLEIVNTYAANDIIELGALGPGQASLSTVPHDLIVDRCYIHGDPVNGQKRGIALNAGATTIAGSYISDIKSSQEDAQAIMGANGPGPYLIVNNYLEASGENILFGGADPSISGLVPSDITIQQNYISKQVAWRSQGWTIKNLIELKNAQRVTINGNLIENNWAAAQQGYAVVLTPRNQDNTAPWSVVQQVQFTNNIVRHVAAVFNILGTDNANASRATNAITIRNNLFLDISRANWGGSGWFMLTYGGDGITVDHNTVFTDGTSVLFADGPGVVGFTFTNNIVPDNSWAIMGTGAAPGNGTIGIYYPGSIFQRNVFIAGQSRTYPTDNFYPANLGAVGFVDVSGGNYRLTPASPYQAAATDSTAIGANQSTIVALVPAAP